MDISLPGIDILKEKIGFRHLYDGIVPRESTRHFFDDAEVFDALIRGTRPRLIIEIGSWMGHSAIHMTEAALRECGGATVICIDTWLGSSEHYFNDEFLNDLSFKNGRPDFYVSFLANADFRQAQNHILPISLPSRTACEVLAKLEIRADLIYIDAGHGYNDVMSDITDAHILLADGGIMFGDDYFHKPLKRAVDDYARQNGLHVASFGNRGRKWVLVKSLEEAKRAASSLPLADFV